MPIGLGLNLYPITINPTPLSEGVVEKSREGCSSGACVHIRSVEGNGACCLHRFGSNPVRVLHSMLSGNVVSIQV